MGEPLHVGCGSWSFSNSGPRIKLSVNILAGFSNSGPRIKLSVNILAGFSNSGPRIKLSVNILAGSRVLSAVGACPLHDGVR
jgi:hypothetical protein